MGALPGQGRQDGEDRRDDVDAEFAALMEGLGGLGDSQDAAEEGAEALAVPDDLSSLEEAGDGGTPLPKAVKVAVVVTPLMGAEALAGLCSMSGLDCVVVPSSSGALAVKELVSAHAEWDVSELLGGLESEPAEAAELASALSRLSRAGVVLMTADLATDVGIEQGLSGTITARRYVGGAAGEEASSGLLLASLDGVVEDLLLGLVRAEEVTGAVRSSEVSPGRVGRWIGRGLGFGQG